jgi:hypothetical protein
LELAELRRSKLMAIRALVQEPEKLIADDGAVL